MVRSAQAVALFSLLTGVFWFELDKETEPLKKLVQIVDDLEANISAIYRRYSTF
jgi:hypothetical protein